MSTSKTQLRTPEARPYLAAARGFAAGGDTPRAFLERCIEAIERDEKEIGAFVATNLAGARAAADAATARWKAGRTLSAVDGMPVGVKDIMETADMPTEQGSPLFAGWRGGRDCAAVAALREAGAVIVGKTVTTEFAATEPRGTRNPWDPARTPGGSSSGSAAAVAAGMVSGALGSQVIGSTLRPASYCGTFGYKPSVGGINRGGSFDGFSQSCTGIIAASLDECWVMTRAITARIGGDPGYIGVIGPMAPPPAQKPRRLALLQTAGWTVASDGARKALQDAAGRLRAAGVEIVDRQGSAVVEAAESAIADSNPLSRSINAWEGRWPLNTYARDMDRAKLSRASQERLDDAEKMSQEEYAGLIARRDAARAIYAALAVDCDACITLAAPGAAPTGLASTGNPIFAVPSSLLGAPALSLPLLRDDGLPLGLQLMGFIDRDAELFALAAGLTAALAK